MKLSTVAAVISFGLPSLTSAWRLRLYRNPGYQVLIEDQSDPFSHACTDLNPQLRGQTSSMHWESEGALGKYVYVTFIPAPGPRCISPQLLYCIFEFLINQTNHEIF